MQHLRHHHRHHHIYRRNQQNRIGQITPVMNALMIMATGFAFVVGATVLFYGFYTLFCGFSSIMMISTFLVFPTLMLLLVGALLPFFTFFGFLGAYNGNLKQIKSCYNSMKYFLAAFAILFVYISVSTFLHTGKHVAVPLNQAIVKYHEDRVLANLINSVQTQFKCCGVINIHDWNDNKEFECDYRNLSVQSCNVPFSCCVSNKLNITERPLCRIDILSGPLVSNKYQKLVYVEGCQKKVDFYLFITALDMGLLLTFLIITAVFVMRVTGSILFELQRRRFENLNVLYMRNAPSSSERDPPPAYDAKETDTAPV